MKHSCISTILPIFMLLRLKCLRLKNLRYVYTPPETYHLNFPGISIPV